MITTVCKISYGSQTVPPIVPAVQGDTGRAISFEIADFTPPAGATATYFILKPSGEAIYNSATITDNSILCELTAQSLAEAGENRMQVRVLQGEDIVTSFEVILMVRTFLGDDAIESGTEMNIFDQAVEQATEQFQENAEQIVEEVIESIPEDYTELTEEVEQLNERLHSDENNVLGLQVVEYTDGYYIPTGTEPVDETPVASSGWSYAKFNCPPNSRISLIGYGSDVGRLYCFFDADGNVLEKSSPTENTGEGTMKTYVTPADTAYCIVNSSNRYSTKYIVIGDLLKANEVAHYLPSSLITDTTSALEDIPVGCYRIPSSVAQNLSWAPTTHTFSLLVYSRSIYQNVETEKFAFAIDTYNSVFFNVSGSNGYAEWKEVFYKDYEYHSFGTLSEYADCIINSAGFLSPSAISIASIDFIKETVVGFRVIDDTIKIAINRYTKAGAHANKQYWYKSSNTLQDGKYHYKFDHANYNYRIYIMNDDESSIHDKAKLINGVMLYENIDLVNNYSYHEADYDTFKKEYNLDALSNRLRIVQEANYQLPFANAVDWMKLYSYYGDTQVVHPKVLYFPNMLFGHKYWLAYTPYPNANAYYENPCIAYSDDGYRFTNIPGNPIDEPTGDRQTSYYSDTHLVYNSTTGKLECWYRLADETNMTESIYRMVTSNGIIWTDKQLLKTINSGDSISKFLSPAVIYEDGIYKVWTVNYSSNQIEYWEYNGSTFSWKKNIQITFSSDGETHRLWHIDVEKIDGLYVLVAMTRQTGTRHWPLYLTTSADNTNWETPWVVIKYADIDKWDSRIYRSCIIKDGDVYRIYYSAYNTSNRYHMAISESSDLHHFVGRDLAY